MATLARLALNAVMAMGLLAPEFALAAPLAPMPRQGGRSDVVQVGGVICDLDGCRDYGYRPRRRIYADPPIYGDQYEDEDMSVYSRRYRPRTRINVEPPPPPPVYVPQRIYRPPVYVPRQVYRPPVMAIPGDHVQWCLNRYRSYNPRTDLYMVRRNVYRHCISPYS